MQKCMKMNVKVTQKKKNITIGLHLCFVYSQKYSLFHPLCYIKLSARDLRLMSTTVTAIIISMIITPSTMPGVDEDALLVSIRCVTCRFTPLCPGSLAFRWSVMNRNTYTPLSSDLRSDNIREQFLLPVCPKYLTRPWYEGSGNIPALWYTYLGVMQWLSFRHHISVCTLCSFPWSDSSG